MFRTTSRRGRTSGDVMQAGGVTRHLLVGPEVGGAPVQVSLLELAAGSTHLLSAGTSELAAVVVSGEGELGGAARGPGTVVHCRPGQALTVRALGADVTLLHLGTGSRADEGLSSAGPGRTFGIDDVADTPTHDPALGFFHMTARLLVDGPSGGRRSFTVGLGTFAPGGGCHALHRHPHAHEALYVWEGQGAHLTGDGGEHPMDAGELVLVAPQEWHGFRNTGSTPVRAFFCYLGVDTLAGAGYDVHPAREGL